jgi:hypothetical protein
VAEGGTGEDSDQDNMQSFTMWGRPPIEEDFDKSTTEED